MTPHQIILQMKYARIIALVAKHANIPIAQAMDAFYLSETFQVMKHSDLYTMSDEYLAEDVRRELTDK